MLKEACTWALHDGLKNMRSEPKPLPCMHRIHKGGAEALLAVKVAQGKVSDATEWLCTAAAPPCRRLKLQFMAAASMLF